MDTSNNEDEAYAAAGAIRQQRTQQLQTAPVVDVCGVVSASGTGGSTWPAKTTWTLSFTFDAWRVGDNAVSTNPMRVAHEVSEEQMQEERTHLQANTIVHVRARVVDEGAGDPNARFYNGPEALLEEIIGTTTSDAELNAHLERLQQPVTFQDSRFGTFTLNRRIDWYEAPVSWNGTLIRLNLQGVEPNDLQTCLRTAYLLWDNERKWNRRIQEYAVKALLSLSNDWAQGEAETITAKEFTRRMVLESITVNGNGSFEFWHDDGDLFLGHSILVSGDLQHGPTHADIPG